MYKKFLERVQNPSKGEVNDENLITIPNQALTPAQIMVLYQQNRAGEIPKFNGVYVEDHPILSKDFSLMEKIDKEIYLKELDKYIKNKHAEHDELIKNYDTTLSELREKFKEENIKKDLEVRIS